MDVKLFVYFTLFSLLVKYVVSEQSAFAYASGSSGFKHHTMGRLNMNEQMEELRARIDAMKERHLKHRMEMLNRHKLLIQELNNRELYNINNLNNEVSEMAIVEPTTVQSTSNYPVNYIQTNELPTQQLISTTTEQMCYNPALDKSNNIVEDPIDIVATPTQVPTEEFTVATVTVTVTEKPTVVMPTVTVTEESTISMPTVSVTVPVSITNEVSESTTTESYSFIDLSHMEPEEQVAAQDFSNLSVIPAKSNEDSSYDDFNIDIRDGEIGE